MTSINQSYAPGTYSWTAPADVTSVTVTLYGGGGGGGGITAGTGRNGGGAGGGYASSVVTVTPGTTYTVVCGAGGGSSTAGGDSSFATTTVVAKGGGGGSGGSGGTHGSPNTGTTTNIAGDGGSGGGGGGGGGGGSSGDAAGPGNVGAAGVSGGGAGGAAVGSGGAGGHGSANNSAGGLTAGGAPGGGGGGATRTATGTQAGSSGGNGSAVLAYTTNDPYVIQAAASHGSSPYSLALAAVAAGSTVIAWVGFLTPDTVSTITLGGVAGTLIGGAGETATPYFACYKWENVTGAPTAIVVTATGANVPYVAAVEVGNPGTVTTGQITTNTSTSISLTPAAPVKGQLVVVCARLSTALFGGSLATLPASPYTTGAGIVGATDLSIATLSSVGTTAYAAAWSSSGSSGANIIGTVTVNTRPSRAGFMVANQ